MKGKATLSILLPLLATTSAFMVVARHERPGISWTTLRRVTGDEVTDVASDQYKVDEQTIRMLNSPSVEEFKEPDQDQDKDDTNEYKDQIFNPNMFWTERSGRFPRKISEDSY